MAKSMRLRALATARTAQDSYEQLQYQNSQMRGFVQVQGWDLVAFCEDRAISGTTRPFDRPGLGAWLARPDKYDILLAARSEVLLRGETHTAEFFEWAEKHSIEIWSVAEGNLDAEVALTRLSSMPKRSAITKIGHRP